MFPWKRLPIWYHVVTMKAHIVPRIKILTLSFAGAIPMHLFPVSVLTLT